MGTDKEAGLNFHAAGFEAASHPCTDTRTPAAFRPQPSASSRPPRTAPGSSAYTAMVPVPVSQGRGSHRGLVAPHVPGRRRLKAAGHRLLCTGQPWFDLFYSLDFQVIFGLNKGLGCIQILGFNYILLILFYKNKWKMEK